MKKAHHIIYIVVFGLVFLALVIVFNFFERSKFSETERRELAQFPSFTMDSLKSGQWTAAVSAWYSDTEPYRDQIMELSMLMKGGISMNRVGESDEEQIVFQAVAPGDPDGGVQDAGGSLDEEYKNNINNNDEFTRVAHAGILVVGKEPNARALMCFGGSRKGGISYAELANEYQKRLAPLGIQVYVMSIPSSVEYYCPEKAKSTTKPQRETILGIHEHLDPAIKAVDVYSVLAQHAAEPIYLRTDHHWAPLGAYYASKQFASVAGVPFMDLSTYTPHTVPGFVGTMYGYSKNIAVKKSPEDFVWYEPNGVEYKTTYINYTVDKDFKVTKETRPTEGKFFFNLKGGMAYSTFMGGDMKLTKVETGTKNGRKLLIIKDSFGNAIPGYLFGSFEEIHVVDCRYFNKNMYDYCRDNGITDLLFANNTFKCCETSLKTRVLRFLDQ